MEAQSCADLTQLLVQLAQADSGAVQTFSIVADAIHRMFKGVQEISVLLLPANDRDFGAAATQPPAAPSKAGGKGGTKAGGPASSSAGHRVAQQQQQQQQQRQQERSQGFVTPGRAPDWGNCCLYKLIPGRGPIVQDAPDCPLSCTAACYAATAARGVVATGDYAARGPHHLDWQGQHERGCTSMAAVPLFSANRPVAVLRLASTEADAFACTATLELLGRVVAPYAASQLTHSTRLHDMRRLVNELITPIAAQLVQQKHTAQLAELGCSVEEAPPGAHPGTCGQGISVAVGGHGSAGAAAEQAAPSAAGDSSGLRQRRGNGSSSNSSKGTRGGGSAGGPLSHTRFQSVVLESSGQGGGDGGRLAPPGWDLVVSDVVLDVATIALACACHAASSKEPAVKRVHVANVVHLLLCWAMASLDIVWLLVRWLWPALNKHCWCTRVHDVLGYRATLLPGASTWLFLRVLHQMNVTPSLALLERAAMVVLGCLAAGLQVRFFLHAPLQLASSAFAAVAAGVMGPLVRGRIVAQLDGCAAALVAVTVSMGLPASCLHLLEGWHAERSGFLPHAQLRRELSSLSQQ